jgi:hypothetical protein
MYVDGMHVFEFSNTLKQSHTTVLVPISVFLAKNWLVVTLDRSTKTPYLLDKA